MKKKFWGIILLLIATTGFGFHNWFLDNRINSCAAYINDRHESRDRYVDGFMRYRDLRQEWQAAVVAENIGQLFKRSDLILYKKIRDASREAVTKAREHISSTKRVSLVEFAYGVGGKAYAEEIGKRFDSIGSPKLGKEVAFMNKLASNVDKLSDEIHERWQGGIGTLQQEIEQKRTQMSSYSQQRNAFYIIYLIVQLIGIALTIMGESNSLKSPANKSLQPTQP